jgi:superfamily II DNA or RNA helicase
MSKQQVPNRILTARGYSIAKDSISEDEQGQIRKLLTVAPKLPERFAGGGGAGGAQNLSFPIYMESAARFYLPRHWAIDRYGAPETSIVPEGLPLAPSIKFMGAPYDYQEEIIQKFLDADGQGLLCVPCGKGKTFMALAIAVRLGRRFMVIVDKEFLLNQWRGEMERFVKGLRIGILQGDKCEIDPDKYDCTICMIQTLCGRNYPEGFFKNYGFGIFDECHHLGAAHFSRTLLKVQPRYALGLSATPTREDGLSKVFEAFLGKPVYWEKTREPDPDVIVRSVHYDSDCYDYKEVPVNYRGEPVLAKLLTKLVQWQPRTNLIAKIAIELVNDKRRQLMILSERKGHLESIEAVCKTLMPTVRMGYYIGGMKESDREDSAKYAQIILATYAMASDALNIKTLNAVILASPRKRVEQSTGRILRLRPDERTVMPVIVDIVDAHPCYKRMWYKRYRYYKECKYTIKREGGGGDAEDAVDASSESSTDEEDEAEETACIIRL